MKILFILPEYYPHSGGGIATYYQHYIDALKPHCSRIKVIVGSGYVQSTDKFSHHGGEVEYLDPVLYRQYQQKFSKLDLLPEYKNNMAAAWAMWQQSNKGDGFDIIECTDFGLGFTPWVIHPNKPVITRMHGSAGQIALHENNFEPGLSIDAHTNAELALLPFCDTLVTHSKANANFWAATLPTANVQYIRPIYQSGTVNPVSLDKRQNYGLVAARIQKWKGPAELCEAVKLLDTTIDVRWYGRDTPYQKSITTNEYLTATYPDVWNEMITPYPPKQNTEIQQMQQNARFGIVPSVWDMFNFTCLEFLAAGTPVICADGAGVAELIEHGVNGYTYKANDVEALAKCIKLLTSLDSNSYRAMALAGQQTVNTMLSSDALIKTYLAQYETVMAQHTPKMTNALLNNVYAPSGAENSISDILDKQPLRKLLGYIKKRVLKKVKNK